MSAMLVPKTCMPCFKDAHSACTGWIGLSDRIGNYQEIPCRCNKDGHVWDAPLEGFPPSSAAQSPVVDSLGARSATQ